MAELKANVWVFPEGRLPVFLTKGTPDTADFADLVENPSAWDGQPNIPSPDTTHNVQESSTRHDEPPRSGRGSGRENWAEYARSHGYFPHSSEDRDDIIVALQAKGVVAA